MKRKKIEVRLAERGERAGRVRGEDKGRAVFPDVASVCWLFAAPAPRITAFTLQLKNSPRDNLFSWSTPSSIVIFITCLHEVLPLSYFLLPNFRRDVLWLFIANSLGSSQVQ